jgi:hypothetical protein
MQHLVRWHNLFCSLHVDVDVFVAHIRVVKSIFRQADEVVVWLGVALLGITNVLESIQKPPVTQASPDIARFGPIFVFQYWRRVWVRLTV